VLSADPADGEVEHKEEIIKQLENYIKGRR